MITPAISVLSAVEGLELLNPEFERAVLPITLGIIVALFVIQRRGTARVGGLFGPIMVLWFVTLGDARRIARSRAQPEVLAALCRRATRWRCSRSIRPSRSTILGAVFLVLTGGEALYADMGHFGKRPVRIAWFALVWPALAAQLLRSGRAAADDATAPIANPFFALAPRRLLPLLVVLATAATIIASQATISGAFSRHAPSRAARSVAARADSQTSADERGQIYVPAANAIMFLAVVGFVLAFGSSSALSAAYGAAVIGTMLITTLLGAVVARTVWQLADWRIARGVRRVPARRHRVRARQCHEDPERRLGAARARGADVRRLRHLARRPREAAARAARARRAVDRAAGPARRTRRACPARPSFS